MAGLTRFRGSWLLVVAIAFGGASGTAAGMSFHLDAAALAPPQPSPPAFHIDPATSGLPPSERAPSVFLSAARLDGTLAEPLVPLHTAVAGPGSSWMARRPGLVLGGFTAAFLGLEYVAFWASAERNSSFQFHDEGWFGKTTYAGGADKASHFVGGYVAGRVAEYSLGRLGTPPERSHLLSAALIAITGTLIEVGDAYHGYGFSWQDALITTAGGAVGSVLARTGWDDTVTFRFGKVGFDEPDDPSLVLGPPEEYSDEVYTMDLRLSGLLPRLGRDPGWARFALLSATYGTKGYEWVEASARQRLLGVEIGLDLYEIARVLGVPQDTWLGALALSFFRYVRVPYTGIGFQVELNSGRLKGPNSFHRFDF